MDDKLRNFIPINRKLFEHQLWCEERDFSRFEAWLFLLKEARFEDTELYDGNKVIKVKRGQIYHSIRFLASAFRWSTKKVGNYLQMLETSKMIHRETVKETGQTIITVCNYATYNSISKDGKQQKKQDGNSKETKYNKDNKVKEIDTNVSTKKDASWQTDFEIYKKGLFASFESIKRNKDYLNERQRYHPNLNIILTIEKSIRDYWGLETGWKKKKMSKTKDINWISTFNNALTLSGNRVFLERNDVKYEPKTIIQGIDIVG